MRRRGASICSRSRGGPLCCRSTVADFATTCQGRSRQRCGAMIMKRLLVLVCASLAAISGGARAEEDPAKRPNCEFYSFNGHAVLDDRTAVLEFSKRMYAPPENKLWFKVTFKNSCADLKRANFVNIETTGCPRPGDVLYFSHRPKPRKKEDYDSCMIDKVEQVPVGG